MVGKEKVHLLRETVLQGLKRPPTFSLILYMQMPGTLKHGKKQNTFIPVPSEELNLKQAGLLVKPSQAAPSSAVPPPPPPLGLVTLEELTECLELDLLDGCKTHPPRAFISPRLPLFDVAQW